MHIREFIEKNYPEYYSIERYPADKTAPFCKVDAPWGIFSNFGRTPLVVDGVSFDCSEKLFQVMKFADTKSRKAVFVAKGQTICRYGVPKGCLYRQWADDEDEGQASRKGGHGPS